MVYFTDTTNVNRIFDSRLTYNKGSAVVHTLRFVLGDSLFFNGLKNFQQNFSFSTASITDLKISLENFTGKNLNNYFSQWLFGEGYPVISAEYASDGTNLFLKVTHTTSSTVTPLFKTPLEIKCTSASGDTTFTIDITQNSNTFIIPTKKNITGLTLDPKNWLLNTVGTISYNPALISLSLDNIALDNSIRIYPNPTTDYLQIENSSSEMTTLSLFDWNGRRLQHQTLNALTILDISALAKGVYLLEIRNATGKISRKVTKI
jgi:hypothetical protein